MNEAAKHHLGLPAAEGPCGRWVAGASWDGPPALLGAGGALGLLELAAGLRPWPPSIWNRGWVSPKRGPGHLKWGELMRPIDPDKPQSVLSLQAAWLPEGTCNLKKVSLKEWKASWYISQIKQKFHDCNDLFFALSDSQKKSEYPLLFYVTTSTFVRATSQLSPTRTWMWTKSPCGDENAKGATCAAGSRTLKNWEHPTFGRWLKSECVTLEYCLQVYLILHKVRENKVIRYLLFPGILQC